jgi:hypothetical protein
MIVFLLSGEQCSPSDSGIMHTEIRAAAEAGCFRCHQCPTGLPSGVVGRKQASDAGSGSHAMSMSSPSKGSAPCTRPPTSVVTGSCGSLQPYPL